MPTALPVLLLLPCGPADAAASCAPLLLLLLVLLLLAGQGAELWGLGAAERHWGPGRPVRLRPPLKSGMTHLYLQTAAAAAAAVVHIVAVHEFWGLRAPGHRWAPDTQAGPEVLTPQSTLAPTYLGKHGRTWAAVFQAGSPHAEFHVTCAPPTHNAHRAPKHIPRQHTSHPTHQKTIYL